MYKIITFFLLLLLSSLINAAPLNRAVFFGDSLSDNGNLYAVLKFIPKSPPYFKGRFTNGISWAENLGNYLYTKDYIDYHIYAYGGATAIYHNPITDSFIPPITLPSEIDKYLVDAIFRDKSQTLFVIWIGANDYLYEYSEQQDAITTKVVGTIINSVERLYNVGARHFLVLNLPDLSRIPYAKNTLANRLNTLTQMHNLKLTAGVTSLQLAHLDAKFTYIDIFTIFNDLLMNPEKYNEKFNTHVTDFQTPCWKGNVFLKSLNATAKDLPQSIKPLDVQQILNTINGSPDLKVSFETAKKYENGIEPCEHAEQHAFWDEIHPSEVVHQILAHLVIEQLQINGEVE